MKIGFQLSRFVYPGGEAAIGPTFAEIVHAADEGGFHSFWVMDHFFEIANSGVPSDPMLEAYTTLGFAAARSARLRLGALVTGVTYRYPGILIKTATTLDVLSGGRSYFGIGAAWFEHEHLGLGVPFPPLKERFELLEETLQLAHRMWSPDNGPFDGTYHHLHLAETLCEPQPVSTPHPPIMIGGSGERKTLRLVAQYADACNIHGGPQLAHKLDVLKRHCDALGRDDAAIEKTTMIFAGRSFDGMHEDRPASAVLAEIREQAALGVDQVILKLPALEDAETMRRLAEEIVAPASEIVTAGR
jgi:F420-dependent oxidoreductase-like protein